MKAKFMNERARNVKKARICRWIIIVLVVLVASTAVRSFVGGDWVWGNVCTILTLFIGLTAVLLHISVRALEENIALRQKINALQDQGKEPQ